MRASSPLRPLASQPPRKHCEPGGRAFAMSFWNTPAQLPGKSIQNRSRATWPPHLLGRRDILPRAGYRTRSPVPRFKDEVVRDLPSNET